MEIRSAQPFTRVLDTMERLSEVLFGLIMVLTFTGAIGVATADRASVQALLLGALGCNLAWGIIDGVMYLMACLQERGRKLLTLRMVRDAADVAAARQMIAGTLPPLLATMLPAELLELMRQKLRELPEPEEHPMPERRDFIGAAGVFLLVFASTFPVVIPFMLVTDAKLALRLSNAVAVAMLFLCGFAFGRIAGLLPWASGITMVLVGIALVSVAIALGG